MNQQTTHNILVVGPSWVGDMVMAQSLFKTLKAGFQQPDDVNIDVIAPAWSVPVLARMPEVRNPIILDVKHGEFGLKKRYGLGQSLRGQYQQAIVLPRSLKAALVPFFAQIPIRTGFLGEMRYGLLNDIRLFDKQHLNQTVKRFVALGIDQQHARGDFNTPHPRLCSDKQQQQATLKQLALDSEKPAIALLPGAEYGPAKQWPLEHFAQLANQLAENYQLWVMGSQKDSEAAEHIVQASNQQAINLCGKTSIAQAIDLIAHCKGALSNDSGLMHIAAALNCPVTAIYGSSSPLFTPPLSDKAAILHLNLPCSPCFKRQCPLGHLDCLKKITPNNAEKALLKVIRQAR